MTLEERTEWTYVVAVRQMTAIGETKAHQPILRLDEGRKGSEAGVFLISSNFI